MAGKYRMRTCLAVAGLALLSFAVASGATLYDNGTFNSLGGNGLGDALQAEDFVLDATSDLTGIRFWSLEAPGAYLGSISWSLHGNNSAEPSASPFASSTATPTRTVVGSALGIDVIQYDFAISTSNVAAGVYWLVLHDGAITAVDFKAMYWAYTNLNVTNTSTVRGKEMNLPSGVTWNTTEWEHAFMIFGDAAATGIPEPGAVILISTGIAAILFRRRRASRNPEEIR